MALVLLYVTTSLIEYRNAVARADVPASEWFEVSEIFVPDHRVGDNPEIVYDREIRVGHRGFWVVEVQKVSPGDRAGVFQTACTGSGVNDYDLDDVLVDDTVSWSWFLGRPCRVAEGTYRIQLTRDMMIPDWPVKKTKDWSNTFKVSD